MDEKTSCLLDRKVRKKKQILEYYAPRPERYNEEDTRLIDEKPFNPVRYWGRKPKDPWIVIGKKPPNSVGVLRRKTKRGSSRREVSDFIAHLVVVVDLASRPRFFVGATVGLLDRPHFSVRAIIGFIVGLPIGRAVSTEVNVAVGFSGLSLW